MSTATAPATVSLSSRASVTINVAGQIAATIRSQIELGVLMALGARQLSATDGCGSVTGDPGLVFDASILPYRKDGTRGARARTMRVEVSLNGRDYYDVVVHYVNRGERIEHAMIENVPAENLSLVLLHLDRDDDHA